MRSHTKRGLATREHIVAVASALMTEHGVADTSLDDIMAATRASKSQLYHYFGGKGGLTVAVVVHTAEVVLARNARALDAVRTWDDLDRWCDMIVAVMESQRLRIGCALGTLAAELADADDHSRELLLTAFAAWNDHIRSALLRLRDHGHLRADADCDALATGILAAVEGGLLLAKVTRAIEPLHTSLRGSIEHIRTWSTG